MRPESLLSGPAQARYEALRRWRAKVAKQREVTTDIIFTNMTLMHIASQRPRTVDELAAMADVGPWKAHTYGQEILPLVRGTSG